MKTKIFFLITLFFLTSCARIISMFEKDRTDKEVFEKKPFSILFSHNINGETHSCGCNQFPLGGMAQVGGKFKELSAKGNLFYVDTGDAFFPGAVIPPTLLSSQIYTAKTLVRLLNQMELRYMVPGDQDFAAGADFLREIATKARFDFLISNLKNPNFLPHKRMAKLTVDDHTLFLVGLVSPEVMQNTSYSHQFIPPLQIFPSVLNDLKKEGYDPGNKNHQLIVLSHSGYDEDEALAKQFPLIDWIIGAHTQRFVQFPSPTSQKTMNVQVLSRNHYIGEVFFDFSKSSKGVYKFHEIRDELKDKLSPNPYEEIIQDHKTEVKRIKLIEQNKMMESWKSTTLPYQTYGSCFECHKKQLRFWQETPHSLAYLSLIQTGEQKKATCLECHSLGFGQTRGYLNTNDIVRFEEGISSSNQITYFSNLKKELGAIPNIKSTSNEMRLKISKSWHVFDLEKKVTHNFANVQCLNCHEIAPEHPFTGPTPVPSRQRFILTMRKKCVKCHDKDQSPSWYKKKKNGTIGGFDELQFTKNIRKVSCPKMD